MWCGERVGKIDDVSDNAKLHKKIRGLLFGTANYLAEIVSSNVGVLEMLVIIFVGQL